MTISMLGIHIHSLWEGMLTILNWIKLMTVSAMPAVSFLLSTISVIVVIYQTILTRSALKLTRDSLAATKIAMDASVRSNELSIRMLQIDMLPNANWILQTQADFELWIDDLKKTIKAAKIAEEQRDLQILNNIASQGLRSPNGIVFDIQNTPAWLSKIRLAGAQYYYDAKAPQCSLWSETKNLPFFEFIPSFIIRCEDSINGIQSLSQMIKDILPSAFLHSPASINDDHFN